MWISMAHTVDAFQKGEKSVTRRFWKDKHAAKFGKNDIVEVYSRSPRNGGKIIGKIKLTKRPYQQKLKEMPDNHFEKEGGKIHWENKEELLKMITQGSKGISLNSKVWVVEFEKMNAERT